MRNTIADWCNGSTADSDSVSRGSSPLSVATKIGYIICIRFLNRSVAQLGRALRSGRRGRKFKSCHSDFFISIPGIFVDKISGIFLLSRRASIFFQKEV